MRWVVQQDNQGRQGDDIVEMIDQNILDRFSLCGSIESNIKYLGNYQQIGVDIIVYGPPQGASLEGVERLVAAKREHNKITRSPYRD